MEDILIIPDRSNDFKINDVHWVAYEESFKAKLKIIMKQNLSFILNSINI